MLYCSQTDYPSSKRSKLESPENTKEEMLIESLTEYWPDMSKNSDNISIFSSELFKMSKSFAIPFNKCEREIWQLQGFLDEDRNYAFCATITSHTVINKLEDYEPVQYTYPVLEFNWAIIDTVEEKYYKLYAKDKRFSSFIATLMRNSDIEPNYFLQQAVIEELCKEFISSHQEEELENFKYTNSYNDMHWELHKCVWEHVNTENSKEDAHCMFFHLRLEGITSNSSSTSETQKVLIELELNLAINEHPLLDGNHGRVHTGNCMSDYFSYYYPRVEVVNGLFQLRRASDNYQIVKRDTLSGCLVWVSHSAGLSFPQSMEESAILRQYITESKQEPKIIETFNIHFSHPDYLSLHVRRVMDVIHSNSFNRNVPKSIISCETTENVINVDSKRVELCCHNPEVTNVESTQVNLPLTSYSIVESKKDEVARMYEDNVTVESVNESQHRSTETGLLFPLSWNIKTRFDDNYLAELHVTSLFAKQEYVTLLSFPSYWEGYVDVDGILRAEGNNNNNSNSHSENSDDSRTSIPLLSIHGYGVVRREHAGKEFDLDKFFAFVESISISKLQAKIPSFNNLQIESKEKREGIDEHEAVTNHFSFSSNVKEEEEVNEEKASEKFLSCEIECKCNEFGLEEKKVRSKYVTEIDTLDKTSEPIWEVAAISNEVTQIISTLSVLANMQEICMCDEHKLMLSAFMGIYYYFYHIKSEEQISNVRAALEWFYGKWVEYFLTSNLSESSTTNSEAQHAEIASMVRKIDSNMHNDAKCYNSVNSNTETDSCSFVNEQSEETNNNLLESRRHKIDCEHEGLVDSTFVQTERCHCSEVSYQVLCLRAFMLKSLESLLRGHARLPFMSAVTALDLITPPWRWLDAPFNNFRSELQNAQPLPKMEEVITEADKTDVKSLCSIPESEQLSAQISDLEFTRLQSALEGTWELIDSNRFGDEYDWILLLEGVSLQERFYEFSNKATIIAEFITDEARCIKFTYKRLFSQQERLIYIDAAAWEWECPLRRCKVVSRACTQSYGDILFIESSINRVLDSVNDTSSLIERVWFTFADSGRRMNEMICVYDYAVDAGKPLASCVRHYKLQTAE